MGECSSVSSGSAFSLEFNSTRSRKPTRPCRDRGRSAPPTRRTHRPPIPRPPCFPSRLPPKRPAPTTPPPAVTPAVIAPPAPAPDVSGFVLAAVMTLASLGGFLLYQCGLSRAKNSGHTSMLLLAGVLFGLIGYWVGGFAVQTGGIGDAHAALAQDSPAHGAERARS